MQGLGTGIRVITHVTVEEVDAGFFPSVLRRVFFREPPGVLS